MRKDNAIFFLSGLVFGLLLGYFVFQSVSQTGGGMSVAVSPANPGSPMGGGGVSQPATSRRVVDPQEVAALESVLQQNPNDNSARVRLGNLYLEAGHDDQAISWFREALERNPGDPHARTHLAQSLANVGRIDEALAEYETVLAEEPANPQALLGLGRVRLYAQQDIRGGLEAWEELVRVAPGSREAESVRDELEALRSAHSAN
jgi:cytochrome c-type biogenesis protein CcmH/NrfG